MLKINKSITVSGTSVVTVDGTDQVVMTMNASIDNKGASSVNKYVQDNALYMKNKTESKKDFDDFETAVEELAAIQNVGEEGTN